MKPTEYGMHEALEREEKVTLGSERAFGLVVGGVLLAIGLSQAIWGSGPGGAAPWLIGAALLLAIPAVFKPSLLKPLNVLWFKLGLVLHAVVNPLVLGAMFFLAFVPTGWMLRLLGKRPLHLRFDPSATTYWVERNPADVKTHSLKNQF